MFGLWLFLTTRSLSAQSSMEACSVPLPSLAFLQRGGDTHANEFLSVLTLLSANYLYIHNKSITCWC